jgi:hypothetical protein
MLFSKFNQALSGDYMHVNMLSHNEICVNRLINDSVLIPQHSVL